LVPSPTDGYSWVHVSPGFFAMDLATSPDGDVFAYNDNTSEVWRFGTGGVPEVVFRSDVHGAATLALGPDGELYLARSDSKIARLDPDGTLSHVVSVGAQSMAFGTDGALYAAAATESGDHTEIIRIEGVDDYTVVADRLGGRLIGSSLMGGHQVFIGSTVDGGLLVFDMRSDRLYRIDLDGSNEQLLHDFAWMPSPPWLMEVSPEGLPYFMYSAGVQAGQLGRLSADGELEPVANDITGDPFAMSFSRDGSRLYIGDSGAVSIIPVPPTE
jgi:hypothetical protein